MAVVVRRYYTAHLAQWRWFGAFIKATKRHHQASTRSDSINRTCLPLNDCTKMGSQSNCAFAQCRTPTNKINEGNKRNLAKSKTDLVGTLQTNIFHAEWRQETVPVSTNIKRWEGGLKGRSNCGRRNIRVIVKVIVMWGCSVSVKCSD